MRRLSIKKAAEMMDMKEQQVRIAIQRGKIPGAFVLGSKARKTYYIFEEQIINLMKGERG